MAMSESKVRSAEELADAMGVSVSVIESGDEAGAYLDAL